MLVYRAIDVLWHTDKCAFNLFHSPVSDFLIPEDNSLSNLDALRGVLWRSPLSEGATSFLSAAFTFNAEALLRELYSGMIDTGFVLDWQYHSFAKNKLDRQSFHSCNKQRGGAKRRPFVYCSTPYTTCFKKSSLLASSEEGTFIFVGGVLTGASASK